MLTPTGFIVESNVIAVLIERRTKIMLYLFGQPNNAYARSQILGSSLVKPRWQWCFFGGFEVLIGSWNYPNNNKLSKVESILMSACIFEHCFFDIVIHRKIKQAGHKHMKFHMPGQSSQIKQWYNTTTLSNHRQETSSRCPHDSLLQKPREPELFAQPRWWALMKQLCCYLPSLKLAYT